jgi:molybdopterin synthase catalytic subunit
MEKPEIKDTLGLGNIWVGFENIDNVNLPNTFAMGTYGALIEFRGCVRNTHQGRDVMSMTYDGFIPLAIESLNDIRNKILAQFENVGEVLIYHRLGFMKLGETSLLVGIAGLHRPEAFSACSLVIELVKQKTPIWKQEHYLEFGEAKSAWLPGISLKNSIGI